MLTVDISYDIDNIKEYIEENKIKEFVSHIIEQEYNTDKDVYLSILITNNEVIKKINNDYRNKDEATDVISFAFLEEEDFSPIDTLGDIIISLEKVIDQSKDYNHSEEREFYYVLCHGMLHLLGYDHIEDLDREKMRNKEEEILKNFKYER